MTPVRVVANRELGGGYRLLSLESPFGPETVKPGQFVMLRAPGRLDPLLPRAFALFDVRPGANAGPPTMDIFYHVVGKMTGLMAGLKAGDEVTVFGPLGSAFTLPQGLKRAVLVAGGVGLAPMLLLARAVAEANKGRTAARRIEALLVLGGRSREHIVCTETFEREGCNVVVTTEDGSLGQRGLVTDELEPLLADDDGAGGGTVLYTCGPEGMLRAVAGLAKRYDVACQASLEARMACGFGICLGCVVKVLGAKRGQPSVDGARYERVCVEGPVFDTLEVCWDE